MRYRTRTKIISVILETANGGNATRTKIMYKALISYGQSKEYLRMLTESDLLSYNSDTRTFKTTEKGLRFRHLQSDGWYDKGRTTTTNLGADREDVCPRENNNVGLLTNFFFFFFSFLLELKKGKFRILITLTPVVGVAAATTPHQSTQISGTATFLNR